MTYTRIPYAEAARWQDRVVYASLIVVAVALAPLATCLFRFLAH